MKIIDVKTYILSAPLEQPFAYSQGWVYSRSALLTEILTDEGISGWGESFCSGLQPPQIAAATVEHALKPLIIGKDPFDVEVLWDTMYNATKDYGMKGAVIGGISSVDIALWDVIGQALKLPIYKLLGGAYRTKVKAYATGFYRRGEESKIKDAWIEEAKQRIQEGFPGIKLKLGYGAKTDINNVISVREAIGPDTMIMLDANHGYNFTDARKIGLALENYDITWFEEPLSPEDIDGYRELKQAISIPLACGEVEFTRYGFRDWITTHATDILQPDVCHSGGLTECHRISSMASCWGLSMNPHCWGTAISVASTLHLLATIPPNPISMYPNEPMLEFDMSLHPFRTKLIDKPIEFEKGFVAVPDGPGLGINVDKEMIEFYAINK